MKIAWITDTHAGVRNDSELFAEYQARFYSNVFFPELEKRNIKTVIHGGDYFDRRKYINFRSLEMNREMFLIPLKEQNIQMHILVGNHDVAFKNTNRLNSPEILFESFDNIKCHIEPVTINVDNRNIILVPWINNDNLQSVLKYLDNSEPTLVCGHFDICGFAMHKGGVVSEHGLNAEVFSKFPLVLSGHYHTQSKVGNIHYTGNPFEFTWSDWDDPRGFWIIDTDDLSLEFVRNPESMFFKIRYDDGFIDTVPNLKDKFVKVTVLKKSNPYEFEKSLDTLYQQGPAELQIIDMVSELSSELTEEEVRTRALSTEQIISEYVKGLENVDESVKTSITKLMRELYSESLNEL